ncbi:Adenine nucleotide alpha hydrolases-like protein [Dioscorea alata]|uniref:Adenine nucleotide alpha hydrolases-like protein n=1 Tax=Dioscorea alata TaxID=55571 RepID=A0ACB7WMC5_DIOAL|nr:Adenine nucleotide alpha hydrolases-like protein [Dioscorea alata]
MGSNSVWEIEEEVSNSSSNNNNNNGGLGSYMNGGSLSSSNGEDVYVAVGKKKSSMDALSWALKHLVKPSTFVYLVHVFPEVHHVPTPLGLVPKSHVSAQQVETYMGQQRIKRREMLQKFMDLCHSSQVQVDTLLIESDSIAKAVLDLIPVLNIKRLIVGASKSNLRKLKGSSKAEQIQKSAPQYCEVTIICDGKQVTDIDHKEKSSSNSKIISEKHEKDGRKQVIKSSCYCFSKKFL